MTLIGVLGGGQLGRMLAMAGRPLGLEFRFLDPSPVAPAREFGELVVAEYSDSAAMEKFSAGLDLATYEFENIAPVAVARLIQRGVAVFPGYAPLVLSRDRASEKAFFKQLGIPTPRHAVIGQPEDIEPAAVAVGFPSILKTRQLGYDGKGQAVVRSAEELRSVWTDFGRPGCVLEEFVPFDRELSIIGVRGADGETVFYPVGENQHRRGILRHTIAPAPGWTPALQARAEDCARRVLEAPELPNLRGPLDYRGVLAIELFERGGDLVANEMAPRVHNSGHWTMDGAETSQFENHLRAILGMPLGPPTARGTTVMVNLIGATDGAEALRSRWPGAVTHLYGKEARTGRKLGHINVTVGGPAEAREVLALAPSGDPP